MIVAEVKDPISTADANLDCVFVKNKPFFSHQSWRVKSGQNRTELVARPVPHLQIDVGETQVWFPAECSVSFHGLECLGECVKALLHFVG